MAQNDFAIPNQGGQAFRLDVQDALQSLAGHSSGATDPNTAVGTTYPYQFWADTNASIMKMRNGADTAWIDLFQLDGEWSTIAFENGTAAAPSIYFKDSGTDTGFYSPGTDKVGIATGGTSALVVDASQRVGIGTTSPGALFHCSTSGNFYGRFESTNADAGINFKNSTRDWLLFNSSAGTLRFYDSTAASDRLVIDTSGNVGIGTASPATLLHVAGTQTVNERTTYRQSDNTTAVGSIGRSSIFITGGGTNDMGISSADALLFAVNGASEAARIDSSGRLLVGTTSTAISSTAVLQGRSGATTGEAILRLCRGQDTPADAALLGDLSFGDSNNGDAARIFAARDGGTWTSASSRPSRLVFSTTADGASSPTERMRINSSGYVYLGGHVTTNVVAIRPGNAGQLILMANNGGLFHQVGSSYYTVTTSGGSTSDVTLKTDIQPIADSLQKLSQIRGVTFSFIDEPLSHSDRGQQIGVIAQEVEPVFPEAVVTGEDGIKAVRYDKLVAPLIEALKEAKERIETLEAKVAALEGN